MHKLIKIIVCVFFLSFLYPNTLMAQMFTKISTGPISEILGNSQGSSWADYDNDGLLDVLITNTSFYGENKPNLLYHNEGAGNFVLVDTGAIYNDIISASCSSSWGDYDNDGNPDLFVGVADQSINHLYHNEGNGNFKLITSELQGDATSDASWIDYDNDGYLDIYLTSQVNNKNILYHNNGLGGFTKVDTGIIVSDTDCAISLSWADFDNDGDLDLFASNFDFNSTSAINRLYINHGNGYFTSMSSDAVILKDAANTTGASWGDYDNDGNLDLYVVNNQSANELFHNNGDGTFEKIIIDPPEAAAAFSVGSTWGDFDNDGDLDLFTTNDRGFPGDPTPSFRDNLLFINNGNGQFTRITTGDIITDGGHSCTAADYDNDGDLDILIVNGSLGAPYVNYLYLNNGNSNNWVTLTCVGTVSNKSAIGTRVKAKAKINGKDIWQMREIAQNTGCHTNNSPRVHFGLGKASVIDSLIVRWPSGNVDVYTNVAPNKFYTVNEGASNLIIVPTNIFAKKSTIDKSYIRKGIDSVLFLTRFSNIYNQSFSAHILVANTDYTEVDSLNIFDDGFHNDSLANDGLYGAYITPRKTEDFFTISVSTITNENNRYFNTPDISRFTTIGPVVLDSISISKSIHNPNIYIVKPFIKNESKSATIKNDSVKLISSDSWAKGISTFYDLPDINPGSTVEPSLSFQIGYIDSLFPGYFDFKVEIMSDGWVYWTDSKQITVPAVGIDEQSNLPLTFNLEQNYPNPFNPTTTIKYSIPKQSYVTLKVYDILGREVATLVNEEKQAGNYEVEFSLSGIRNLVYHPTGMASGIYFYQLKAGDYVSTKKMTLLK